MTSIEPETRDALRLLARARTPDAPAIERAWAAMQVRLVDGPAPTDIGPDDARRRGIRPLVLAIAAAALVVLAVGVTRLAGDWALLNERREAALTPYGQAPPVAEEVVTPPAGKDAPAPSTTAISPAPSSDTREHASGPAARSNEPEPTAPSKPTATPRATRRSNSSAAPAQPPGSSSSDLEAELRLLGQASAAMRDGRNADALRVLDQHAREFPRGQLAPERDYKRARVTCELGQVEAARELAQSFMRAYPRSPMRAKAREICREPAE